MNEIQIKKLISDGRKFMQYEANHEFDFVSDQEKKNKTTSSCKNMNEEFFLIKDGFLQNVLCDLTLCSRFKQIKTATQFNYFNNMLTVSAASLKLEMNLPYNDTDYEFDVKFIDPRTAVFDFSTGLLDCQLIGYENESIKLEALHFSGSILSLINNAQFVSSDYFDLEDYTFKEYIVNIRKENEND